MTELEALIDEMMVDALGLEGSHREAALRLVEEQRAATRSDE
jgi:hypothetical protein